MANPVLVLGCGSIGRRHIGNLRKLGVPVVAFDPDPERGAWVVKNLKVPVVSALAHGWKLSPRAVWICTPPSTHAKPALEAIRRGIPCFVEKPLAHTVSAARSIARAARLRRVPVAVGYQLRRHPGLRWLKAQIDKRRWGRLLFIRAEVGQYLPDWRPWQDYRKSYTARRALGGGILLDASHEIDLVRWLAGEADSVFCASARLSGLKIDVEDTAALVLRLGSRTLGEVHLDMVQRAPRRGLHLAFENGVAVWDMPTGTLRIYSAHSKRWKTLKFPAAIDPLYVLEAKDFLRQVATGRNGDSISPDDGARTLAVVDAAHRSSRSRKTEPVR